MKDCLRQNLIPITQQEISDSESDKKNLAIGLRRAKSTKLIRALALYRNLTQHQLLFLS